MLCYLFIVLLICHCTFTLIYLVLFLYTVNLSKLENPMLCCARYKFCYYFYYIDLFITDYCTLKRHKLKPVCITTVI